MIDLHSHILPGVDDGPADLAGALALAEAAVAAGTRTIAATPHIAHGFGPAPSEVPSRVAELQRQLDARRIPLQVVPGGEIAMSRAIDLGDEELADLRLGSGRHVLVECPLSPAVGDFGSILFELRARGHAILLAHPERCPAFQRDPARLARLVESGLHTQVTASAFAGRFGQTVRRFAISLLRDGLVTLVASDAHDAVRRPPGLSDGLAAAERDVPATPGLHQHLTRDAPAAVVSGEAVPPAPTIPRRSRLGERIRGGGWRR